nr:MAG TPA: hypothetical protein [Podoviridae sp. ctJ6o53]
MGTITFTLRTAPAAPYTRLCAGIFLFPKYFLKKGLDFMRDKKYNKRVTKRR